MRRQLWEILGDILWKSAQHPSQTITRRALHGLQPPEYRPEYVSFHGHIRVRAEHLRA